MTLLTHKQTDVLIKISRKALYTTHKIRHSDLNLTIYRWYMQTLRLIFCFTDFIILSIFFCYILFFGAVRYATDGCWL